MKLPERILRLSTHFQPKSLSSKLHNRQYVDFRKQLEKGSALDSSTHAVKLLYDEEYRDELARSPQFPLQEVISNFPLRDLAIDIGSGSGWISYLLSRHFDRVISIEPSSNAIAIAKDHFLAPSFGRIEWRCDYAEKQLHNLDSNVPILVTSSVVLSHLRDDAAKKVLAALDENSLEGSQFLLTEAWGDDVMKPMWRVRTRDWWRASLPNCQIDFFGPNSVGRKNEHLGLLAIRN